MRKVFRVYFKDIDVDIEESDVSEASKSAVRFLQSKNYTFKINNVLKVELISEPITLSEDCEQK